MQRLAALAGARGAYEGTMALGLLPVFARAASLNLPPTSKPEAQSRCSAPAQRRFDRAGYSVLIRSQLPRRSRLWVRKLSPDSPTTPRMSRDREPGSGTTAAKSPNRPSCSSTSGMAKFGKPAVK